MIPGCQWAGTTLVARAIGVQVAVVLSRPGTPGAMANTPSHARQSWRPDVGGLDGIERPIRFTNSLLDRRVWPVQAGTVVSPRAGPKGGAQAGNRRISTGSRCRRPLPLTKRIAVTAATPQAMDHKGAG